MSGSINLRFPHGQVAYYEATCDVCDWKARRLARTATELAQRQHETQCRPPLPEVIPDIDFPWPPCPICDGDLSGDDGWWCDRCEVAWAPNGTRGERQGEDQEASR